MYSFGKMSDCFSFSESPPQFIWWTQTVKTMSYKTVTQLILHVLCCMSGIVLINPLFCTAAPVGSFLSPFRPYKHFQLTQPIATSWLWPASKSPHNLCQFSFAALPNSLRAQWPPQSFFQQASHNLPEGLWTAVPSQKHSYPDIGMVILPLPSDLYS